MNGVRTGPGGRPGGARLAWAAAGAVLIVLAWLALTARPAPAPQAFHERWALDREPEYAYPPLGLEALPAQIGRAVRAQIAIRIDAGGAVVGIDARIVPPVAGVSDEALREAIAEAFAPVSFLPGRLDGRAVPVVKRYELELDPKAPLAPGFATLN